MRVFSSIKLVVLSVILGVSVNGAIYNINDTTGIPVLLLVVGFALLLGFVHTLLDKKEEAKEGTQND